MAADEQTTWGEVCKNVSYRDGLFRVCKDKVPEFTGFAGGAFDDRGPERGRGDPDFSAQLARSAQPIPPPPPAGWEPEPEGFMGGLFESLTAERVVMYGGLIALIWYFFLRKETPTAASAQPTSEPGVTSPKAA